MAVRKIAPVLTGRESSLQLLEAGGGKWLFREQTTKVCLNCEVLLRIVFPSNFKLENPGKVFKIAFNI